MKGSFVENSPVFSYTVKAVPAETELLRNAVAPLYFPFIKVGTGNVIGSFNVISVIV